MNTKFKVIGYSNSRDARFGKNWIEFTDIESLLKFINTTSYWQLSTTPEIEVCPSDDWDVAYKHCVDYNAIYKWEIVEMPTTVSNLRIVGIDCSYAQPQQSGMVIYDNIDCKELSHINKFDMCLITLSIKDFLNLLVSNKLNMSKFDYIALKTNK